VAALRLDLGQLPIRDRAVLRIVNRVRLANAEQLGTLVYHSRRYTQIRLRGLWDLGYHERSAGMIIPTRNLAMNLDARTSPARFLIRDRDTKFSGPFEAVLRSEGMRVIRIPVRAPNAKAYAERAIETIRAE